MSILIKENIIKEKDGGLMMFKPGCYKQERNCIEHVQNYVKGKKVLIVLGAFNTDVFQTKIVSSLSIEFTCIVYEKECTKDNIQALAKKMKEEAFDSIIGMGGGKILDIVKAVSYYYYPCELIVIPSSASMDGACSALSVLYHEDHSFDCFLHLPKNPDVVLVDSQIVFEAPFRLLCAGMADAISSYYDAVYVQQTRALDEEVIQCAKRCYDVIFNHYQQVKQDYENKVLSKEVELIIRTNIYDSAIAFENAQCEFSHVLANATTKVKGSIGLHGERVGVSTLFQLKLENKMEDFNKVKQLLKEIDMPTTLLELNIKEGMQLMDSIVEECKELNINYTIEEIKEALTSI